MNTLYLLIKPLRGLIAVMLLANVQFTYSQTLTDTIPTDTIVEPYDSIHPFHRKRGDVLNYLLVDNFFNPALAGSLKSYQAQAGYGNTLPGSANNHQYGQIMLDMFFGNKQGRHGLAYRMEMNHIGFTNSIRQRFDYSFQVLNKKNVSLRFGAGVGFLMQQYTSSNFTWGDMIDYRYGFIYASQDQPNVSTVGVFNVARFQWNVGGQLRIFDGYLNFYNANDFLTTVPSSSNLQKYYPTFGVNALYNVDLNILQMVPSFQFNYWNRDSYLVQGGVMLASNTSKGGGGGIYYNNNNIFTLSGLFAWNDVWRVYAQFQFPFSDLRYTYPLSGFQLTVSYKINDFGKYE